MSSSEFLAPQVVALLLGETLNRSMDFESRLPSGQSLASIVSVSAPLGLTVSNTSVSGSSVSMQLTASTAGVYTIEVTVTTSGGQTLIGRGRVRVES